MSKSIVCNFLQELSPGFSRSLLLGILLGSLLPSPAVARPPVVPTAPTPPVLTTQGALAETTYFGGTIWDGTDARWEALEDSTWTFDTGIAPLEGWTSIDFTAPSPDARARRISTADPRWTGTPCVGSDAGLGGSWSFWFGLFQSEADSLCYVEGQGYGEVWDICIAQTFAYAGSLMTLEFDYVNESEQDFDFTYVKIDTSGDGSGFLTYAASITGVASGHDSLALTPGLELPISPVDSIQVRFCFESDGAWSDEDGLNPTTCGAFAVDNVSLTGIGLNYFTDFETDDGGWEVLPPEPGPGGNWARLEHLDDLPPTGLPPCGLADSVLVFFDPGSGAHPLLQDNTAMTPWIDLAAAGVSDRLGKFVSFDAYTNLDFLNYIFAKFVVQWYPDTCAVTGAVQASPIGLESQVYNFDGVPACSPQLVPLTSLIPPGVERIRVGIGVINLCSFYSNCSNITNPSPWFDNVRVGVHDIITIQDYVNAAAEFDTVRISAGTYTGPGNFDISFGGKRIVLLAPAGPRNTIIDCQGDGRGFVFNSGENTTSVVSGFTIRNGFTEDDGGGVLVEGGSGVTLENCVFENCEAVRNGGGIYAPLYSVNDRVRIRDCRFLGNTAGLYGGGAALYGDVRVEDSEFLLNDAGVGGGGCLLSTTGFIPPPQVLGTWFHENQAASGGGVCGSYPVPFIANGVMDAAAFGASFVLLSGCTIENNIADNDGGGAVISNCTVADSDILENTATRGAGLFLLGGMAERCRIAGNTAIFSGGGAHAEQYFDGFDYYYSCLFDCVLSGNEAVRGGGIASNNLLGPELPSSMACLTGCTVSGNSASQRGGGIFVKNGTTVDADRTIFWGNCADVAGGDILAGDSTVVTLTCSLYDTAGVAGLGTVSENGTQVKSNPRFCSLADCSTAPSIDGSYALASNSPCLPAFSPCGTLIGALGDGCAITGVPGEGMASPVPVLAAFPNPFRGSVGLVFQGSPGAETRITIFDLQGRVVRTARVAAGVQGWTWDGVDDAGRTAPPGVYFVRVRFTGVGSAGAGGDVTASSRVVRVR